MKYFVLGKLIDVQEDEGKITATLANDQYELVQKVEGWTFIRDGQSPFVAVQTKGEAIVAALQHGYTVECDGVKI